MEGNYDHDVIGIGNQNHPANKEETEEELTIEENLISQIEDLERKLIESQTRTDVWRNKVNSITTELEEVLNYSKQSDNSWLYNKIKALTIFN